jgi:hypothetical protein
MTLRARRKRSHPETGARRVRFLSQRDRRVLREEVSDAAKVRYRILFHLCVLCDLLFKIPSSLPLGKLVFLTCSLDL